MPEWLTEARVALGIAILSAIFTGFSLRYTRRLAINDTNKMKRKELVVEIALTGPSADLPGWEDANIVVRNLELVAAKNIAINVKKRGQRILTRNDAFDETGPAFALEPTIKAELPVLQRCSIMRSINPQGTPERPQGFSPSDTIYIRVFVQEVSKVSDFEVEWEWADGKPH